MMLAEIVIIFDLALGQGVNDVPYEYALHSLPLELPISHSASFCS